MQPAFDVPQPAIAAAVAGSRTRIEQIMSDRAIVAPEVTMEGGVVVLRGTVATNYDRIVAERMALIQPGVAQVRNELTVEAQQ
jgi:osmotically-inducible protein OsmY